MTVPLSEAVASSVPVELIERKDMGDLCAWITFETVKERVEKRRTSPDCCCAEDVGGEEVDWLASEVVGEGTGEGYARYELSADGDSAHIAESRRIGYGVTVTDMSKTDLRDLE